MQKMLAVGKVGAVNDLHGDHGGEVQPSPPKPGGLLALTLQAETSQHQDVFPVV